MSKIKTLLPCTEALRGPRDSPPGETTVTAGPDWLLEVEAAATELFDTTGLSDAPPLTLEFHTQGEGKRALVLPTPVVCQAPNGLGKSTFVHLLCGAKKTSRGEIRSRVAGYDLSARAVLQEGVLQLFGKSPAEYLKWSFRESEGEAKLAEERRLRLEAETVKFGLRASAGFSVGSRAQPNSLLQAKLALVAARLTAQTNLLVLDEPSYGLSRVAATAFVEAVAALCAELQIGLLIVSHTEWFHPQARSFLSARVERAAPGFRSVSFRPFVP